MYKLIIPVVLIKKRDNRIGQIGLKYKAISKLYISRVFKKRLDNLSDLDSYIYVLVDKKRRFFKLR